MREGAAHDDVLADPQMVARGARRAKSSVLGKVSCRACRFIFPIAIRRRECRRR
jgi:hypothetical protein